MERPNRGTAILGIGTTVPPHRLDQEETFERLADSLVDHEEAARWARRIFKYCGVETRYTCEPNLLQPAHKNKYYPSEQAAGDTPTTADRMVLYQRECVPLAMNAARKALADSNVNVTDITHLITVSCTGFYLPGLDVALIQNLGLPANVNRMPLTFLGCAAGLTAIRLSKEIIAGNSQAKVLIVCVELCTIHIQASYKREDLFATAFFGDGASACIVGEAHSAMHHGSGLFFLRNSHTAIFPHSVEEMVWKVGNYGFNLYLSPKIPKLISQFVPTEIEYLLDNAPVPDLWAIHPGGRGIIDAVQTMYGLTDVQTRGSRAVLRRFGNLSSATILFVLQELREELTDIADGAKEGIALAFGPGLNAELLRMTYTPPVKRSKEVTHV